MSFHIRFSFYIFSNLLNHHEYSFKSPFEFKKNDNLFFYDPPAIHNLKHEIKHQALFFCTNIRFSFLPINQPTHLAPNRTTPTPSPSDYIYIYIYPHNTTSRKDRTDPHLLPVDYLRQMLFTDEDSANFDHVYPATTDMPQCPHCHRYYETEPKLKAHIQKYCLKEKKYKCFYCNYRSKRRDHIRRHMLKVHASETNARIAQGLSMDIDESLEEEAAAEAAARLAAGGGRRSHVTGDSDDDGGMSLSAVLLAKGLTDVAATKVLKTIAAAGVVAPPVVVAPVVPAAAVTLKASVVKAPTPIIPKTKTVKTEERKAKAEVDEDEDDADEDDEDEAEDDDDDDDNDEDDEDNDDYDEDDE